MSLNEFVENIKKKHEKELDEIKEFQKLLDTLNKPEPQIISIRVTSNN
jgi:hypothetical protein